MLGGILAGLSAGALWGLVFVAPNLVPDLPSMDLVAGRYSLAPWGSPARIFSAPPRSCLTGSQTNSAVQTDHFAIQHVVLENVQRQLGIVEWRTQA